jgi:CSLREA domain-containing protein
MTSKSQKHSIVGFLQLPGNKSSRGILIGLALLGVFLIAPAQAAVFTVNSPADVVDASTGNGICETAPGNGVCTLRAAIQEANALAGADQIILPPNTYVLTIVTELTITSSLTITGGDASTTIIDGNKGVRTNSGVLVIDSGTVSISGVTIRNGGRTGNFDGGGIRNNGTLTLTNSTVSGNNAGSNGLGGGIANFGTLTLTNSTVSENSGRGAGGIHNDINDGKLTLVNSTVSRNSANNSGAGGISNDGTLTLTNSTVSGNSAANEGGGIFNTGTLALITSTVSGNGAGLHGGGIYNNGTANLFNATVTDNGANADFVGGVGRGWRLQYDGLHFQPREYHSRWKFCIGA